MRYLLISLSLLLTACPYDWEWEEPGWEEPTADEPPVEEPPVEEPTPAAVPVEIMSPGSSVTKEEMNSITAVTGKICIAVLAS